MEQQLSPHRLWLLIRNDVLGGYRTAGLYAGVTAALIFLLSVAEYAGSAPNPLFYRDTYGFALFIWGIWATSRAFRPLQDRSRTEAYLLLPASALEKMLARLLLVTAGLALALLVCSTILSLVIEGLNLVFFGDRRPIFNPFDAEIWELIAAYIVVQSPYFLGSAWFRRAPFLKTSLAVILLLLAFAVFALFAVRIALGGPGWGAWYVFDGFVDWHFANGGALENVFLVLMPPVLWCIAWLRLKEAQADDAV